MAKEKTQKPNETLDVNSSKLAIRDEKGRLKKGVKLNPNGRPKGTYSLSTKLRQALEEYAKNRDGKKTGKKWDELLISVLINEAVVKKDIRAIKEIFDRAEGKAKQTVEVSGSLDLNHKEYIQGVKDLNGDTYE